MIKRTIFIFSFIHFFMLAAMAQTSLSKYQPGVTGDGAVYFLPKTALRVSVLVEKTSYKPGEFCKFAERYLRLNDVEQEPNVSYKVLSIQLSPTAVADTSKAYSVKFNPLTAASNIRLSDDGVLLAINAEPLMPERAKPFKPAPRAKTPDPRQFMSEEIISAGSTAKMAELTASEIYDLRENHSLLIKGQADFMPKDGEQLRLMLNQLETQETALGSLFAGTTKRDTTEMVIVVRPDQELKKQVLFRLSQKLGVVDIDDLAGTPYYISVENLRAVPPVDEAAAKKKKKPATESGIYVNVPGKMRVTIYDGITPPTTTELPAPQFGNVELLSGNLFNKRFTTHLILNPLTGALEKLDAEIPKK